MSVEYVPNNPELQKVLDMIRKSEDEDTAQEPKALPDHEKPGERITLIPPDCVDPDPQLDT